MTQPIETEGEIAKDREKLLRKRKSKLRGRFVTCDGHARPEILWQLAMRVPRMPGVRRGDAAENESGAGGVGTAEHSDDLVAGRSARQDRAMACVERVLGAGAWTVWAVVIAVPLADALSRGWLPQTVLVGALALGVGCTCWLLVMLDMATYRPRLFAVCSGPPEEFFGALGRLSPSLKDQVQTIVVSRPRTFKRAKEQEQSLLEEANTFLLLDGIRARITRRVLHRLAAIVGSLGVIGFGLSLVTKGGLVVTASGAADPGGDLPAHVSFALGAFYGYGDVYSAHAPVGYAFMALVAASFAAVVYFILTDIITSQSEFRVNLRHAAESYVLQNSRI